MSVSKTTTLISHWHVISPAWDGFAMNPDERDGGKVLGIADLLPKGTEERKGTWRIVVEFTPEDS